MTRGAFITAVVTAIIAIVLNPISIFVGYYLSKSLAAPKLSIEYITPVVETEPLILEKSLVTQLINPSVPLPIMPAYADPYSQCTTQFRSFSLSLDCAKSYQTHIQEDLDILKSRGAQVHQDIQAVAAWDGKAPLAIPVLYLPGEEPMEFAYMPINQKGSTLALLGQWEKEFDKAIQLNHTFLNALAGFVSSAPRRTGIFFKVGVLNSGDSDGVIFPGATLSFLGNVQVSLIPRSLIGPTDIPVRPFYLPSPPPSESAPVTPFNVVHAHSFTELSLSADATTTPPGDLNALQSAVQHESQEAITIGLKSSDAQIFGKGRLPG